MLILASGLVAHWDALTIKKAFQWGLFFEHLFRHFSSSDDYEDAIKELDAALLEMTSNPLFPQGLAHLSSETFTKATEFVLAHLLHTLPLRDAHLRAFLTAAIDMDLDEHWATESDCLHVYLNKLRLQSTSLTEIQRFGNFIVGWCYLCKMYGSRAIEEAVFSVVLVIGRYRVGCSL